MILIYALGSLPQINPCVFKASVCDVTLGRWPGEIVRSILISDSAHVNSFCARKDLFGAPSP